MNKNTLRVIPLGGLGHIGGNMMVYETADELFVVDCGVLFPTAEQPGVDYVIPDITYVRDRIDKLTGIVLTHAHEDHFGALPYVLKELDAPVFGTRFTLDLLDLKLSEFSDLDPDLVEIDDGEPFMVGRISIRPVPVTHSIPGAVALVMDTPIGKVVHTGDFKLDPDPIDGRLTGLQDLQAAGDAGVAVLLSDSTNADRDGHTWSEREVGPVLEEQISSAPGRVLVTTFASNLHRLQLILDACSKAGRKVVILGRSLTQNVQLGLERGYLRAPHGLIVDVDDCGAIQRSRLLVIASGSQGEPRSAMSRIASGNHGQISAEAGDRVIFSARRIPGNERSISTMINHLVKLGAEVVDDRIARVHTSGHAFAGEQRRMIELCRPTFFVPVHGEYRHLARHAALAERLGVPASHTLVTEDGLPLEFEIQDGELRARRLDAVPSGHVFVDGSGVGDVGEVVLRDRLMLAETGMVMCVAIFSERGDLIAGPHLVARGVVEGEDQHDLLERATSAVRGALKDLGKNADAGQRADAMKVSIRRFFKRELARRPLVIPLAIEV